MCNALPPAPPGDFCCALVFTVQPIFSGAPMPQDWFYNSPRNIYRAVFTAVLVRLIYKRKVGGKHL